MKKKTVLRVSVFLLGISFALSGCAALNTKKAAYMEDILSSAGFVPKQPVTPEDLAKLDKATPLEMVRATKNGQVFYVYPDPYNCKCAYVGTEEQYQEYRRLAFEKQTSDEKSDAAIMREYGSPDGSMDDIWW